MLKFLQSNTGCVKAHLSPKCGACLYIQPLRGGGQKGKNSRLCYRVETRPEINKKKGGGEGVEKITFQRAQLSVSIFSWFYATTFSWPDPSVYGVLYI